MLATQELSSSEKLDWLRLIRSENVGPVTFYHLLGRYGSAGEALKALPELARNGGRKKPIRVCPKQQAVQEARALVDFGGRMIGASEPGYPPLLKEISDPPPLISVKGPPHLLTRETLGIVGSRNASAVALKLTAQFAAGLSNRGLIIASGLARGIDSAAHQASLAGGTVAVLGGGIDVTYPRENAALQQQIAEQGCLVAEQPFGTTPQARHFPRRNRIISGLSRAILVMEATPRSGSLITARFAAEQGRDVFAVPGSPMDPRARGTNNLIRNGALLAESVDDIMAELATGRGPALAEPDAPLHALAPAPSPAEKTLSEARPRILELLSPVPISIDELIRLSDQSPSTILTILLELELAGGLERHFGNRVSLTR
ncbi:DNA-processing protein DprA [Sneathiella chinensis]|uniref:DNA processing protein DprA n=1 Tax=Sneathiella chinensis TaxID=349750 RepID=A0ABQ5U6X0_9PROT|nr:DNA-processing protein DprA [Sneathiella chinensis]GLQ07664.1 DNA processing protein DprA [Sneathiella chinensis]